MQSENKEVTQAQTGEVLPAGESGKVQVLKPKKCWTNGQFVEAFATGKLGRKGQQGNFRVHGSTNEVQVLKYKATGEGYSRCGTRWDPETKTRVQENMTENIAVKLTSGLVISNANRLEYCESSMAWGNRVSGTRWGNAQTKTQRTLEKNGAMPVPFSVFEQAKLDISMVRVVDKAKAENLRIITEKYEGGKTVKEIEKRHYVGACLLEVDGTFFLFDIDREELKHKLFNPFVVKLPREAKTIKEAYDILIPDAVKKAIKTKRRWERQGEWFFVFRYKNLPKLPKAPKELQAIVDNPPHVKDFGGMADTDDYKEGETWCITFDDDANRVKYLAACEQHEKTKQEIRDYSTHEGELRQGTSRPNTVEKYIKVGDKVLVTGKISHTGREHRDLLLKDGWYEAIPNTAVGSWQVSGEID